MNHCVPPPAGSFRLAPSPARHFIMPTSSVQTQTRAFRCKYRGIAGRDSMGMGDDPLMPMPAGKTAPCNRACRFAYPGEEAVYCQKHKMSGMVDVVNPSCKVLLELGGGGGGGGGVGIGVDGEVVLVVLLALGVLPEAQR